MAFSGIHPAPAIEPTEFGLFSYAKPEKSVASEGENWVRGFSKEYQTEPNYVRNLDETDSVSYLVSSNPNSLLFREIKPFYVEVEDQRSTFSLVGEDRFKRVLAQLEGVTQKAVEYELWNGDIAQGQGLPNLYLSKSSVTTIAAGAKFSPVRAMSLLEHYSGEMSPAGEHGVIHLTRDAYFLIATNSGVFLRDVGKEHIQTSTGTPVVIGSGYSGDGPHVEISTIAVSGGNTATITTATPHYLIVGETVKIQTVAGGTAFDGSFVIGLGGVSSTTQFTLAITTSNQSATATPGTVQMQGDDNTKWIYATGAVHTHVGKAEIVNDSLAQGYDVAGNKNDMKIKAYRPAAAYFDPSIHLAVKVDLTA
jgi:hypothetical protein